MDIRLTVNDFRHLSGNTQSEILSLFSDASLTESKADSTPLSKDEEDRPEDITLRQVKQLMAGVNDLTKQALQLIADRDGRVNMSDIKQSLKIVDSDWAGMQSGLTRRLRTVIGDAERKAYLISWEHIGEEWVGSVSRATCKSLQNYFRD